MWWHDAVIYQIYPRSFQDSDGDGVGDLPGIRARLGHLVELGVDALWMSPIYPSPLADFGYDVTDHAAVDPTYGTLEDFDALLEAAHARDLRVLMDLVPGHTSIEHRWFRERPDYYVWAPGSGGGPPNNWRAAFGGPAWTYDEGRGLWYLHSFYPEQPQLDWRNPDLVEEMQAVIRFWLDRGVDGFRVDAVEGIVKDSELRDDPPASAPFALPLDAELAKLERLHSSNRPEIRHALGAVRAAAGDSLLVGEVYLPAADSAPYLDFLDAVFAFELFHARWDADTLGAAIEACAGIKGSRTAEGAAWMLSNHDFPRVATRFGRENERLAAMLLMTLPGAAFLYQGDEIGLGDGPGADPAFDRAGRDAFRHPMQWEPSPTGGFTSGEPWLPAVDPVTRSVAAQRSDPDSLLSLYRRLIALRPRLGEGLRLVDSEPGALAYERGRHLVTLNLTGGARRLPVVGELVLTTGADALAGDRLVPHAGAIQLRATGVRPDGRDG